MKGHRGILLPIGLYGEFLVTDEIPPAIAAARRALWLPDSGVGKPKQMEQLHPEREVVKPMLGRQRMISASGEVLKKKRAMGPWEPDASGRKLTRGSAALAIRIAKDPGQQELASKQFESLIYTPSTSKRKESLFSLWE